MHGVDAERALQSAEERYLYAPNKPVMIAMTMIGAICVALTGTWVVWRGVEGAENIAVAAIGAIATIYFLGRVLYWFEYSKRETVGITGDGLLVGDAKRVWFVHWTLLDDGIDWDHMDVSKMKTGLEIGVAKETIKVLLFNAYVYLDQQERFVGTLLERIVGSNDSEE